MQVKNSKGFPLICMVLLLSVLLSGCTMLQSQKKVQDLEFTVVRPEEIPETLKEQVESKLEEKFTLTQNQCADAVFLHPYANVPRIHTNTDFWLGTHP